MDKNIPQNIPTKAPETRVDLHWENIKESNKADMPNTESGSLVNLHSHNKNMIMRKRTSAHEFSYSSREFSHSGVKFSSEL